MNLNKEQKEAADFNKNVLDHLIDNELEEKSKSFSLTNGGALYFTINGTKPSGLEISVGKTIESWI